MKGLLRWIAVHDVLLLNGAAPIACGRVMHNDRNRRVKRAVDALEDRIEKGFAA